MSLILLREDYFPASNLPIAVAERMPQPSFPPHRHTFSEIIIVWRGNDLYILNDRPWLITSAAMYFVVSAAVTAIGYDSVNNLALDNIFILP